MIVRIEGCAVYVDKSGKRREIEGYGSLSDDRELKRLNVEGSATFDELSCDKVKISGECSGDTLIGEKITIEGDVEVGSIKAVKSLEIDGDFRIDSIESDEIVINSQSGTIGEIKCNNLKIFCEGGNFEGEISFGNFRIKSSPSKISSRVRVKKIEAADVELENCRILLIKCKNAVVGSDCLIDKLIVSGKFELDNTSKVGEVIRE